jgi:hypothetical protein
MCAESFCPLIVLSLGSDPISQSKILRKVAGRYRKVKEGNGRLFFQDGVRQSSLPCRRIKAYPALSRRIKPSRSFLPHPALVKPSHVAWVSQIILSPNDFVFRLQVRIQNAVSPPASLRLGVSALKNGSSHLRYLASSAVKNSFQFCAFCALLRLRSVPISVPSALICVLCGKKISLEFGF